MVVAAEQHEVVERGDAAVDPVPDVMGVAHHRRAGAAGKGAVGLARHEGSPDRGGDEPAVAADVEDAAVGVEQDPDQVAVAGEAAYGGTCELEPVFGHPDPGGGAVEGGVVDGDGQPRTHPVAGGWQPGVEGVLGQEHEGVPHPGAVVARIGQLLAGVGVDGRRRSGQRQQRGPQGGAVLHRAVALEPDPAAAVIADGEEPAQMGGTVFPVERLLRVALLAVGIDHPSQVAADALQVGGVEPGGLLDHELLPTAPDVGARGESVDGADHDRRLVRRERPGRQ